MRLAENTQAPAFEGQAISGRLIGLDAIAAPVRHLQFHRFASCPVCNLNVQEFIKRYPDVVAAGVKTTMLFHSPVAELKTQFEGTALPFEVIGARKQSKRWEGSGFVRGRGWRC